MFTFLSVTLLFLAFPTTKCFLHLHTFIIHRNCAPRDTVSITQATEDPHDGYLLSRIDNILMERRQKLLSDPSKLKELHPQSSIPEDNELRGKLTDEVMVREVLLSSRLPLPFLNRTKLGPSTIEGAGRGLFATEDIADGEVITCYPGDLLLCEIPSSNDEGENEFGENEDDGSTECVALWGNHVPSGDRWDDDAVFDGTETNPPLLSYAVSVDYGTYSNMGHPSLDDNPAYYGHFVNDGAGHLALEKANSPATIQASLELGLDVPEEGSIGIEENIAAYVLKSLEVANAIHKCPDDKESHVVTVATRDIQEGEEIMVTYGPEFWAGHDIDG